MVANRTEPAWLAFPPDASARVPLTWTGFAKGALPFYACFQLSAYLYFKPGMRWLQRAILPIGCAFAYHGFTVYDPTGGGAVLSLFYSFGILANAMRMISWALFENPPTRTRSPSEGAYRDGADLMNDQRGIGWSFGRHTYLPPNSHASASRGRFILSLLPTLAKDVFFLFACPLGMALLSPPTFASPLGGSIFHAALSPLPRLLVASGVTALLGLSTWHGIDLAYTLCVLLVFVLPPSNGLPPADPALWPPLARSPWRATSVAQFWSECWHQLMRRIYVVWGGKPGGRIAGRAGAIMGAFVVSEVEHALGIWQLSGKLDFQGFFVLMGVGIILEEAFTKLTGVKVGGWTGRVWALSWVVGWGTLLANAWLKQGLVGTIGLPPVLQQWQLSI